MTLLRINNRILKRNGTLLTGAVVPVDPYNPLGLPPYTIRCKFADNRTPNVPATATMSQYSVSPNIWDITYTNTDWTLLLQDNVISLLEVLGANTSGVTVMKQMFYYCQNMSSVALFDTRNVTTMEQMFIHCDNLLSVPRYDTGNVTNIVNMFYYCQTLTSLPLFDLSSVTSADYAFMDCKNLKNLPLFDTSSMTSVRSMFHNCNNVESGALALYNQMSSQANPPSDHLFTFRYCGSDTTTGAAELAQIPSNWK